MTCKIDDDGRCRRCGIERPPVQLLWLPCRSRAPGVTRRQFLISTIGRRRADKFFEKERGRIQRKKDLDSAARKQQRNQYWNQYTTKVDVVAKRKIRNAKYHQQTQRKGAVRETYLAMRARRTARSKTAPSGC